MMTLACSSDHKVRQPTNIKKYQHIPEKPENSSGILTSVILSSRGLLAKVLVSRTHLLHESEEH